MRLTILLFLMSLFVSAQGTGVTDWINSNAVAVDNTQISSIIPENAHLNQLFKDRSVYGFGEATHHTREFFELKAKFFRYLAENEGVRVFMMEDDYYSGRNVNSFIAGGEGSAAGAAQQMGFSIWRTEEVKQLIQWMHDFNACRPENDRIRFYGIDCQVNFGLADDIRSFAAKHEIAIKDFDTVLKDATNYEGISKSRLKECTGRLSTLKELIAQTFVPADAADKRELDGVLFAITNLRQCTELILSHNTRVRDDFMADNVKQIMQNEGPGAKGFIWAHNNHIGKNNDQNHMGYLLKGFYGDAYYSVGFDFGQGVLFGQVKENGQVKGKLYNLEPLKDSYAEIFVKANAPVFLFDINEASHNTAMASLLKNKKKVFNTGNSGYSPKLTGGKVDYSELYDAVLFVRTISPPHYLQSGILLR